MSVMTQPMPRNVDELLQRLAVPAERIRLDPRPGWATEQDAIESRYCELIDGTLVEKAMGWYESRLGFVLIGFIEAYLAKNDIAFGLESSGMIRVAPQQIRLPDVSVFLWEHFPDRKLPVGQILDLVPDWSVEILSPTNTKAEMQRKRRELFASGTKLIWEVDPPTRTVEVFTAPDVSTTFDENATLDASAVLPGFKVAIRDWLARAGKREE